MITRSGARKERQEIVRISITLMVVLSSMRLAIPLAAGEGPGHETPSKSASGTEIMALPLPDASADGVTLDYLAADRARHQIWVPAGGTGNTVVIDTRTQEIRLVENFPTREAERNGVKRMVGPSSATVGDGVVYVGNRGDSSVCAVDAITLVRGDCVTLSSMPDGLAFVRSRKEVWATTPREQTITILDVSTATAPKLAGSFKLDGMPEGYAVDDGRGLFYTNLEDKDRTLRIDVTTRKVTATWMPSCGEDGPRGLALETNGQLLMVACPDHVEVLDAGRDGHILSKLDTGQGVDNFDYLPEKRSLYAAASGAARLTVAHLDKKGELKKTMSAATAKGARNAVADESGVVYIADGPDGRILVVRPTKHK
jgi:Uncharacterized conserved protein